MKHNIAIEVSHLSKCYQIGNKKGSIRDTVRLWTSTDNKKKTSDFWAINDLSFNVNKGDVLGVVGKNGAGKSTLLKLLSRITKPTSGRIEIHGRVSSLLEVGTGFHPELTGRENVFLNGTILGMKRAEIKSKFDEIVEFSGIEKFIDTPAKYYSSGMYVRLAFAVAAFLEPEILIIDEILAVGDAAFQQKCIGKIKDVAVGGRTVLFVSHDIDAVTSLCTKGMLIDKGSIVKQGDIHDVITTYTKKYQDASVAWDNQDRPGDEVVRLNRFYVCDRSGKPINQVGIDEEFGIVAEYEVLQKDAKPAPNFHVYTGSNTCCFVTVLNTNAMDKGLFKATAWIPPNLLNNQTYRFGVAFTSLKIFHIHLEIRDVIQIDIVENKLNRNHEYGGSFPGTIRPDLKYEIVPCS